MLHNIFYRHLIESCTFDNVENFWLFRPFGRIFRASNPLAAPNGQLAGERGARAALPPQKLVDSKRTRSPSRNGQTPRSLSHGLRGHDLINFGHQNGAFG